MSRRLRALSALVLLIFLASIGGAAAAPNLPDLEEPSGRGLVLVAAPSRADLERLAAAGLPVYAHFETAEGAYALAGGGSTEIAALAEAGLSGRVLDADTTGAAYYLAYPPPGRARPDWAAYGKPLFVDERVALLRTTPAAAERLAEAGAEIVRISLTPKPLGPAAPAAFPIVTTPNPMVQAMIDQVSTATVYQYTGDLSGAWATTIRGAPYTITTRNSDSGTPVTNATYYVGDHLAALGLDVEYHQWDTVPPAPYRPPNVIGELTGETNPGDIYMITGHLDDMPSSGLAPGADDNASGSVAVLVAADILTQYRWGCTLRFALWTGEEQGLLGSAKYAQRSSGLGETIRGVLNLDMIAWNTLNSSPVIELHTRTSTLPATAELANQFASVVNVYGINLTPQVISYGSSSSDHASFWTYGYTAILGIEDFDDFNPYYHTSNDALTTLNMGYYTEFVKASVGAAAHMSNCLLSGSLEGDVTAAHDGSGIADAALSMTDTQGVSYTASTDSSGHYSKGLPPATYAITATKYGYLPAAVTGVALDAGETVTQDFVLTAAAPAAPAISVRVKAQSVVLLWSHIAPNTTYQAHRATSPYFTPGLDTLKQTLNMPFVGTLSYSDAASGMGNPLVNHFYTVLGLTPAGQGAASNRVGEFDFALVPGG